VRLNDNASAAPVKLPATARRTRNSPRNKGLSACFLLLQVTGLAMAVLHVENVCELTMRKFCGIVIHTRNIWSFMTHIAVWCAIFFESV
jgi:hypothetical protein